MDLRRRAEQMLLAQVLDAESDDIGADELAHELRLYQVELELQNEQLRLTQHDLEENRDHYRELVESSPIALVVLDERGVIEEANERASSILGAAQLIGRPLSAWMRPSDGDCIYLQL